MTPFCERDPTHQLVSTIFFSWPHVSQRFGRTSLAFCGPSPPNTWQKLSRKFPPLQIHRQNPRGAWNLCWKDYAGYGTGAYLLTDIFLPILCLGFSSFTFHYSFIMTQNSKNVRGKSLLELLVTTFLADWQLHLIFVRFISNFLCMCSNSMASAYVILR